MKSQGPMNKFKDAIFVPLYFVFSHVLLFIIIIIISFSGGYLLPGDKIPIFDALLKMLI